VPFAVDLAVIVVVPTDSALIAPVELLTVATEVLLLDQVTSCSVVSEGSYVTGRKASLPSPIVKLEGMFNPTKGTVTVTVQVAVFVGSAVDLVVMVAVPPAIAVICPVVLTVATEGSSLDQVTPCWVVSGGVKIGVSSAVPFLAKSRVVRFKPRPVMGIMIVTVALALMLLFSVDVAVMVAVPAAIALISPVELLTVATAVLLLDQVTPVSVVSEGVKIGVSVSVPPLVKSRVFGFKPRPVMGIVIVTVAVALILPFSVDVAVMAALPAPTAVICPVELSTVATEVSLLDQVTPVWVVLIGA
jgi:hypothetical protein